MKSNHIVLLFSGPWRRLCLPPPCSVTSVPNSTSEPRLVHGLKRHMGWGGASRPFARCLHWSLPLVYAGWHPMAGKLDITLPSNERHGISNHQQLGCLFNRCLIRTSIKSILSRITGPLWGESGGIPSKWSSNLSLFASISFTNSGSPFTKPMKQTNGFEDIIVFVNCFRHAKFLAPGRCNCNLNLVIFKLVPRIYILRTSREIALRWMPQDPINN